MKTVFADTSFYIALADHCDEHHRRGSQFAVEYQGDFVTSAWVVEELADYLCDAPNRPLFISMYQELLADPRVTIVPLSTELFERGIELYAARLDKNWSLTHRIPFLIMERFQLREAAAADHHFVKQVSRRLLMA